jgi:hypothetical protein
MADKDTKPTQEQLLKTVSQVLDEALAIYEEAVEGKIEKSAARPAPAHAMDEGIDAAMNDAAGLSVMAKPVPMPGIGDGSTTAIMAHGSGQGARAVGGGMAKDEDGDKDKDKKDKDDMEKKDAELISMFKSIVSKMEERGLMQKMAKADAAAKATMKKSETDEAVDDLRKSLDERFGSMAESISKVAETVKKIAAQPKERKGVTGYQPLKKSEGPAPLRKSEIVGKLLELQKSGAPGVNTLFITRVEQGRLAKGDEDKLRALGVIGE